MGLFMISFFLVLDTHKSCWQKNYIASGFCLCFMGGFETNLEDGSKGRLRVFGHTHTAALYGCNALLSLFKIIRSHLAGTCKPPGVKWSCSPSSQDSRPSACVAASAGCWSGLRRHSLNSHINNVQAFQAGCSCTCKTCTMSKYSATVRFQAKSWINLPNKTSVGELKCGHWTSIMPRAVRVGRVLQGRFLLVKRQACRPDCVAMPSLQGPSVVSVVTMCFFSPQLCLAFSPWIPQSCTKRWLFRLLGGVGGGGEWMPLHSHEAHWLLIEQTQASLILLILMGNDYIWPERHGGPLFHDSKCV